MSDEKPPAPSKITDADLEEALDALERGEETTTASEVITAMAAMIEGVRKAVA